jgi:hypothetical protein
MVFLTLHANSGTVLGLNHHLFLSNPVQFAILPPSFHPTLYGPDAAIKRREVVYKGMEENTLNARIMFLNIIRCPVVI